MGLACVLKRKVLIDTKVSLHSLHSTHTQIHVCNNVYTINAHIIIVHSIIYTLDSPINIHVCIYSLAYNTRTYNVLTFSVDPDTTSDPCTLMSTLYTEQFCPLNGMAARERES